MVSSFTLMVAGSLLVIGGARSFAGRTMLSGALALPFSAGCSCEPDARADVPVTAKNASATAVYEGLERRIMKTPEQWCYSGIQDTSPTLRSLICDKNGMSSQDRDCQSISCFV
jgi:hypothetical protein